MAQSEERPLLEEHHLSYARDGEQLSHEITVYLCRWCHAKVHNSWARITDDVAPIRKRSQHSRTDAGASSMNWDSSRRRNATRATTRDDGRLRHPCGGSATQTDRKLN